MLPQQRSVTGNAVRAFEQAQSGPKAHRIVGKHRLAELALEPLDNPHRGPVAAGHENSLGLRPVSAAAELISFFRAHAAKLDRCNEPEHLAVNDAKVAHL